MLRPALLLLAAVACLPDAVSEDPSEIKSVESFQTLTKKARPSIATIKVRGRDGDQIGMGTGFVIQSDGLIVTNFHVISEGRPFTVEMSSGRTLPIVSVAASDRTSDLALVQVDVQGKPLQPLPLSDNGAPAQGTSVLAFGNPLGLRDSVVAGIVSAVREVEGREMIQLAMPIQAGNSGGPLVDSGGNVVGIINMKSAIDDNLGFAIPIDQLGPLRDSPNPVMFDRWVRLGRISEKDWTPLFGATWQQRGGLITARGLGDGFGGRSLCLSTQPAPELPVEIAVRVRLDDESGAAGIAFHSDGHHRHYGFYPSNGQLRLTCFKGPSVYSWQVLEELESEYYRPGGWNRLRVRIEPGRLKCFINGHLVVESTDQQLSAGRFGLVKFRDTKPDFKAFKFGNSLPLPALPDEANTLLAELLDEPDELRLIDAAEISMLGRSSDAVAGELARHARQLEQRAEQVRRLAADVQLAPTLDRLTQLISGPSESHSQLLQGALLIAKLDDPDVDVEAYRRRVEEMADEIRSGLGSDADATARRQALHRYLFDENGFHGGRAEYYHPANSHLNRVIDEREGLPITLSILYMKLGRLIGITIEGVGLPGHFVVRHVIDDDHQQLVDVFDRGRLLSREDAAEIVAAHAGRKMTDRDLRGQTTVEILTRVLNNLVGIAGGQQDVEAIYRYCEALVAISPQSVQSRMMRSRIRAITGRREGAISDLDWLIETDPPGLDRDRAIKFRQSLMERGR